MNGPVAVDPAKVVVDASWRVVNRLNPNVPWPQDLLDLQHALVAYERAMKPRACSVCGEALAPGWVDDRHARCWSGDSA